MPAVTLKQRMTQRSQKDGVFQALSAVTWALVTSFCGCDDDATKPAGFQSGAGTRTVKTPNIMKRK